MSPPKESSAKKWKPKFPGAATDSEEDPYVTAQRFINVYRQLHVLREDLVNRYNEMLLGIDVDARLTLTDIPGGNDVRNYLEYLEHEKYGDDYHSESDEEIEVTREEKMKAKAIADALTQAQEKMSQNQATVLAQAQEESRRNMEMLARTLTEAQQSKSSSRADVEAISQALKDAKEEYKKVSKELNVELSGEAVSVQSKLRSQYAQNKPEQAAPQPAEQPPVQMSASTNVYPPPQQPYYPPPPDTQGEKLSELIAALTEAQVKSAEIQAKTQADNMTKMLAQSQEMTARAMSEAFAKSQQSAAEIQGELIAKAIADSQKNANETLLALFSSVQTDALAAQAKAVAEAMAQSQSSVLSETMGQILVRQEEQQRVQAELTAEALSKQTQAVAQAMSASQTSSLSQAMDVLNQKQTEQTSALAAVLADNQAKTQEAVQAWNENEGKEEKDEIPPEYMGEAGSYSYDLAGGQDETASVYDYYDSAYKSGYDEGFDASGWDDPYAGYEETQPTVSYGDYDSYTEETAGTVYDEEAYAEQYTEETGIVSEEQYASDLYNGKENLPEKASALAGVDLSEWSANLDEALAETASRAQQKEAEAGNALDDNWGYGYADASSEQIEYTGVQEGDVYNYQDTEGYQGTEYYGESDQGIYGYVAGNNYNYYTDENGNPLTEGYYYTDENGNEVYYDPSAVAEEAATTAVAGEGYYYTDENGNEVYYDPSAVAEEAAAAGEGYYYTDENGNQAYYDPSVAAAEETAAAAVAGEGYYYTDENGNEVYYDPSAVAEEAAAAAVAGEGYYYTDENGNEVYYDPSAVAEEETAAADTVAAGEGYYYTDENGNEVYYDPSAVAEEAAAAGEGYYYTDENGNQAYYDPSVAAAEETAAAAVAGEGYYYTDENGNEVYYDPSAVTEEETVATVQAENDFEAVSDDDLELETEAELEDLADETGLPDEDKDENQNPLSGTQSVWEAQKNQLSVGVDETALENEDEYSAEADKEEAYQEFDETGALSESEDHFVSDKVKEQEKDNALQSLGKIEPSVPFVPFGQRSVQSLLRLEGSSEENSMPLILVPSFSFSSDNFKIFRPLGRILVPEPPPDSVVISVAQETDDPYF